jgi:nucleoside-diphosphate-sugar epimerase
MRKALFIGGTGTISMAITRLLAKDEEWELYLLNRGSREGELPEGVKVLRGDVNNEPQVLEVLGDLQFDSVCDFIGFVPEQLERDYRLFRGRTKQFMYISSASAYQKPVGDYRITEGTPLANPYWEYSRNKIACEELLMKWYREDGFPVTIIRPSHTYDERNVPMGAHGDKGSYQVLKRMMEGKPILVHGDGTSLWTMTHNSDFAKGFVGLLGNVHAIGECYQITNDETLTWNQIYQAIADALGVEYKPYYVSSDFLDAAGPYDFKGGLTGDKSNCVVFDNTKLKRAVPGLCMNVRFEQGVRRTIEYVLSHPECQVEDPEFDAWCDKVIEELEAAKKRILQG